DTVIPKTRRQFYYLLKILTKEQYGLRLCWYPHRGNDIMVHFSTNELEKVLTSLSDITDSYEEVLTFIGHITSINSANKTFKFKPIDSGRVISGNVSPTLYNKKITLAMETHNSPLLEVKIRERVELNELTYEESFNYELEDYHEIESLDGS
ncbi:MAG: hypothetical protein OWQ57_02890, partial [Sulfobacillus sp.]|nr:hypothetical protein [Sulfobacillus sp.]